MRLPCFQHYKLFRQCARIEQMFENLLHQDIITEQLRKEIQHGTLPPALLFSGPAFGGKLTAALETARALSCREGGAWNCYCGPCRRHRTLMNPHTLLLGNRNMEPEIAASVEILARFPTSDTARYLLVRAVQKLLRRFDFVLWDGDERKLNKDALSALESLPESIENALPGNTLPSGKKLDAFLKNLKSQCSCLQKCLPGLLPIAQSRRIGSWAQQTLEDDHKTIILDSADRMLLPSENSLLKFLEEPPPNTTIILVTTRKAVLLPTTISRLRNYTFRRRTQAEEQAVLKRVFREEQPKCGLREFFLALDTESAGHIEELAGEFLEGIASNHPFPTREIAQLKDLSDLDIFLNSLINSMQSDWRAEHGIAHAQRHLEVNVLRKARMQVISLNLPIPLVLRNLYMTLEEQSSNP